MSSRIVSTRTTANILVCFASLLLSVNIVNGQAQPQTTGTPAPVARRVTGPPFPTPRYIPPHSYDQRNIKLDLRFDWEKEEAIGTETITLAPTKKARGGVDREAAFMPLPGAIWEKAPALNLNYEAR